MSAVSKIHVAAREARDVGGHCATSFMQSSEFCSRVGK